MLNKSTVCFTTQPNSNKSITEGIFVSAELMSKTYAKSRSTQIVIMMVVVIRYLARVNSSEKLGS